MANDTNTRDGQRQVSFWIPEDLHEALIEIKGKTGLDIKHLGREGMWEQVRKIRETHAAYQIAKAEPVAASTSTPQRAEVPTV